PAHALRLLWPAIGLLGLVLFNVVTTSGFLSIGVVDGRLYGPLINIVVQASPIILVAIGMTLVIATGGIDLSVGSVMAVAGAAAGMVRGGAGLLAGMGAGLAAGLLVGAASVGLAAYLKIHPIIATVIFLVLGRGIAMMITGGEPAVIHSDLLLRLGPL